jgi:hypothetical protein
VGITLPPHLGLARAGTPVAGLRRRWQLRAA